MRTLAVQPAVCSGKIRNEDYREAVESALHMIRHGQADIMKTLKARMEDAAERLDFERAALIRTSFAAIEKVSRGQKSGARSGRAGRHCLCGLGQRRGGYFRASARGAWPISGNFCFTTRRTLPPCATNFCPAII